MFGLKLICAFVLILHRDKTEEVKKCAKRSRSVIKDQPILSFAEIVESHLHHKGIIYVESCSNSSFAPVFSEAPRGASPNQFAMVYGKGKG